MKQPQKTKWMVLLLCVTLIVSMFGAVGAMAEENLAGKSFELATRQEGVYLDVLKELIAQFQDETGVTVVLTEYIGDDYESAMKTRMASNELPDMWETHGWSRLRYGEYLMPLNDEAWYNDMTDLARGILEGPGDTGYALMVSCSVLAMACNLTAAEDAGVDLHAIETLDDFVAACQTMVDSGIVPLVNHESAGDLTHVAGIFTSYDDAISPDGAAQLDGTWDWESFMTELEWYANLLDMGAFWADRTTMTAAEDIERVATGKSAMYFANGTGYIQSLIDLNPENDYAVLPFPAATEGANRYVAGGEGYAIGIWNETSEPEACKAFLSFLAKNGAPIVEAGGGLPAFTNYEVAETTAIRVSNDLFERYPESVYVNMWDREYMPSGMWPVFREATGMLYADNSEANLVAIKDFLKGNYEEKWEAANNP